MRGFLVLLSLSLTGCSFSRLFQSTVPAPVVKASALIESERQAADLIAQKIETPVELKPVAISLSTSLGAPTHSLLDVKAFSLPIAAKTADTGLHDGIVQMQAQLTQLNAKLTRLQGKDIDGTGISILSPSTVIILGILITLGTFFPPAFTILFALFRRLRTTTATIVQNIDEAAKSPETADAIATLKSNLATDMDSIHKRVVRSLQKV